MYKVKTKNNEDFHCTAAFKIVLELTFIGIAYGHLPVQELDRREHCNI